MVDDPFGALVGGVDITIEGAASGPLHGQRFVAKDVFDIAGHRTGAGNPTRRATAAPAAETAVAVSALLAAGATLVGKSRTDELAYGLSGENELDGSPRNPAAPGYRTGGSSSGSAAAVAAGLADIGLGTDTGGSIRVPASHCGLIGFRPTHGRVSCRGVVPLAPSFDTVGWLTRDAATSQTAGEVLLATPLSGAAPPTRLVVFDDVAAIADAPPFGAYVEEVARRLGATVHHEQLGELDRWREAFRIIQAAEAWAAHGDWIRTTRPEMNPAVAARFAAASRVTEEETAASRADRAELQRRLEPVLADAAVVVPAATGPPLAVDADAAAVDRSRYATLTITALASLLGTPAVAWPMPTNGLPIGVSLVAAPGADAMLFAALHAAAD